MIGPVWLQQVSTWVLHLEAAARVTTARMPATRMPAARVTAVRATALRRWLAVRAVQRAFVAAQLQDFARLAAAPVTC